MIPARPLVLLLAAAASAGAGCAPARLRVDPAVAAAAEAWDVSGANPRRWDAPLAFGPYRTGPVADAGTLGWSVAVLDLGVAKAHRPYAYALRGPAGAVDAECHQRGFEAWGPGGITVDAQGAAGRPVLACAFRAGRDGARTWRLTVRAAGGAAGGYLGELTDGAGGAWAVRSAHALEGSPLPLGAPAGWAFERGGAAVGMVETLSAGRVWLPRGAGDEEALAAAAAALLLFQPDAGG